MSSLEHLRLVSEELERELRSTSPTRSAVTRVLSEGAALMSDAAGICGRAVGDEMRSEGNGSATSVSSCAFLLGGLVRSSFAAELLLADALEEPNRNESGELS
jgi:hypothetical protein